MRVSVVSIEEMYIILPCPLPQTLNLPNTQVLPVLLVLMSRNLISPALILSMLPRSKVRLWQRASSILTLSPGSTPCIHAWAQPHNTLWSRGNLLLFTLESLAHRDSTLTGALREKVELIWGVSGSSLCFAKSSTHSWMTQCSAQPDEQILWLLHCLARLAAPPWLGQAALLQMEVGV